MDVVLDRPYKSLQPFVWKNLPRFCVLTGPNGSGKTQILEIIYAGYSIRGPIHPFLVSNVVQNEEYKRGEVRLYTDFQQFSGHGGADSTSYLSSLRQMFQMFQSADYWGQAQENVHTSAEFIEFCDKYRQGFNFSNRENAFEEFRKIIPPHLISQNLFYTHETLSLTFWRYYIRTRDMQADGMAYHAITTQLGPPPWEVLNNIFAEAGLDFEFSSPIGLTFEDHFHVKLHKKSSRAIIDYNSLSSGEKTLISINLWLFNVDRKQPFPKLLLLDEPDAHLHPSMAQQFLNIICSVLVKKYGIRVIMTTHSPSTVALAPPESVFEISSTGERVASACSNIDRAIRGLTAGLITVTKTTKFVLVEDESDQVFYQAAYQRLCELKFLTDTVSIVFIPAAIGTSKEKTKGGCEVVKKWAEHLASSGFRGTIYGLIDHDANQKESDNVKVLSRYSVENYLLDPILVYRTLLDSRDSNIALKPLSLKRSIRPGDEAFLDILDAEDLQKISDYVINEVESKMVDMSAKDMQRISQKFATSSHIITINLPLWLINMKGHFLFEFYRNAFKPHNVSEANLLRNLRRSKISPLDLIELFQRITFV